MIFSRINKSEHRWAQHVRSELAQLALQRYKTKSAARHVRLAPPLTLENLQSGTAMEIGSSRVIDGLLEKLRSQIRCSCK